MGRNVWTGAISFGLVNVPIGLQTAVTEKTVRFKQLNRETGALVRQKRFDSSTNDEVPFEDIVKGYELTPDRYVVIDPEELEALEPTKTKRIDIEQFSPTGDINPVAYGHAYNVIPQPGGEKGFRLLMAAMVGEDRVAIGRVVLRTKEYLVAIRPSAGGLVLQALNWADEINEPASIPSGEALSERELDMARALVDSLSKPFVHGDFVDEGRAKILHLIERKAAGEEIVGGPEPEGPAEEAPNLMAALEASLMQVRGDAGEPSGRIRAVELTEEERV